jgi:hypothetical protein
MMQRESGKKKLISEAIYELKIFIIYEYQMGSYNN